MVNNLYISSFKRIFKDIYFILLLFIVAEILVRVFYNPQFISNELYLKTEPNYNQGITNVPLCYRKGDKYHLWQSASFKPHKKSFSLKKSPDEFRVFVFGISISYGEEHKNYSYYLEKILNSVQKKKKVTVVNCSYPMMGTAKMLSLYMKSLKYEPDLIILDGPFAEESDEKALYDYKKLTKFPQGFYLKSSFICLVKKFIKEYILKERDIEENKVLYGWIYYNMKNKGVYNKNDFKNFVESYIQGRGPYNESKDIENLKRWQSITYNNLLAYKELSKQNRIPTIVSLTAFVPFGSNVNKDMYRKNDVKNLFLINPRKNFNDVIENIYQSDNDFTIFNKPQFIYDHLHLYTNKFSPFSDSWHMLPKTHLLVAKGLAQDILKNHLQIDVNINDFSDLAEKYLLDVDKGDDLLHKFWHIDFIVLFDATQDKEILIQLERFTNSVFTRTFYNELHPDMQKLYKYWIDSLNKWMQSKYIEDHIIH